MRERSLRLSAAAARDIRRHGEETYPHECCGALVGQAGEATAAVPLSNTTEEGPRRRFLVRPSDYRLAERRATELGGALLGFYHSHPDHPARPSQYDLDHAWPTFAYVIVSVAGDARLPRRSGEAAKAGEVSVWFLKEDRSTFEEGTLHHGDENPDTDPAPAVHG